jgi:pimeloyl-ACP methyl ester carboxylesterase
MALITGAETGRSFPQATLRRLVFLLLILFAACFADVPAFALDPSTTGVVLMHGKWLDSTTLQPVTKALKDAGFLVDTPEMPWSGSRLYDRSCDEAYDEIDAATARLIKAGAKQIVVAGHSSGAAAAFRYAGRHGDLAAVVLIAPAPVIESERFHERIAGELARAQEMAAAGQGDAMATFLDFNSIGHSRPVNTTANHYLSYNAPDGPAAMSLAAPAIGAVDMLWIAASEDPGRETFAHFIQPQLSTKVRLKQIVVTADHLGAPAAAAEPVVAWLLALKSVP